MEPGAAAQRERSPNTHSGCPGRGGQNAASDALVFVGLRRGGFDRLRQYFSTSGKGFHGYRAELLPLNTNITQFKSTGEVTYTISGDQLTISVAAEGAPSNIEHWQHFHGLAEGDQAASCPGPNEDNNDDGTVDVIEIEPVAETTMVPFHDDPVSMEIVRHTYPTAGAGSSYSYTKTVSLSALEESFATQFGGQRLDPDRRVVILHGVPASTRLPAIVVSLEDIPAHVTLPIACGEIMQVDG